MTSETLSFLTTRHGFSFALDVLHGLSSRPRHLPSRYFYDARGSELFQRIMELPEYHLTRCEQEILQHRSPEMVRNLPDVPLDIIELGAGDGRKTYYLLQTLLEHRRSISYLPVDISISALETLERSMRQIWPHLPITPVHAEYFEGLIHLRSTSERRKLVLFLGSNIGNFTPEEARRFLRGLWLALNPGDFLLIGFDRRKNPSIVLPAYNDSQGLTKAFNLNLLERINRELGGNFDTKSFTFYATYHPEQSVIASYLISRKAQEVYIEALHRRFRFESEEPIHTEYSFKFSDTTIEHLARDTGFWRIARYLDSQEYFVDELWEVTSEDA